MSKQNALPAHIRAAADAKPIDGVEPSGDKLTALRKVGSEARDLEEEIASLEEQLSQKKEVLNRYYQKTLPDMMEAVGLDTLGIPAEGNHRGVDYVIKPYYSASISDKWDPTRKQEAFDLLKKFKAESLIKTEVSAALPKGQLKLAKQLVAAAKKLKISADLKMSVHSQTLKSWLKELYEEGQTLSDTDLAKIGGSVGRVVKPEIRD